MQLVCTDQPPQNPSCSHGYRYVMGNRLKQGTGSFGFTLVNRTTQWKNKWNRDRTLCKCRMKLKLE